MGCAAIALVSCSLLIPVGSLTEGAADDADDAAFADGPDASDDRADVTDGSVVVTGDAACDATFCDDFESLPFGGTWTGTLVAGGGTIGPVDGGRTGMGAAAVVPEAGTTNRAATLLLRAPQPKRVSCAFSMRPDVVTEPIRSFGFAITANGFTRYAVFVQLLGGSTNIVRAATAADGASSYENLSLPYFPTGSWEDVRLTTDFKTVEVYVGGAPVQSLPSQPIDVTTVDIELGLQNNGSQASVVTFDDVRCNIER